jgi:hypothetical protein
MHKRFLLRNTCDGPMCVSVPGSRGARSAPRVDIPPIVLTEKSMATETDVSGRRPSATLRQNTQSNSLVGGKDSLDMDAY